jgi:hypothetical protein
VPLQNKTAVVTTVERDVLAKISEIVAFFFFIPRVIAKKDY